MSVASIKTVPGTRCAPGEGTTSSLTPASPVPLDKDNKLVFSGFQVDQMMKDVKLSLDAVKDKMMKDVKLSLDAVKALRDLTRPQQPHALAQSHALDSAAGNHSKQSAPLVQRKLPPVVHKSLKGVVKTHCPPRSALEAALSAKLESIRADEEEKHRRIREVDRFLAQRNAAHKVLLARIAQRKGAADYFFSKAAVDRRAAAVLQRAEEMQRSAMRAPHEHSHQLDPAAVAQRSQRVLRWVVLMQISHAAGGLHAAMAAISHRRREMAAAGLIYRWYVRRMARRGDRSLIRTEEPRDYAIDIVKAFLCSRQRLHVLQKEMRAFKRRVMQWRRFIVELFSIRRARLELLVSNIISSIAMARSLLATRLKALKPRARRRVGDPRVPYSTILQVVLEEDSPAKAYESFAAVEALQMEMDILKEYAGSKSVRVGAAVILRNKVHAHGLAMRLYWRNLDGWLKQDASARVAPKHGEDASVGQPVHNHPPSSFCTPECFSYQTRTTAQPMKRTFQSQQPMRPILVPVLSPAAMTDLLVNRVESRLSATAAGHGSILSHVIKKGIAMARGGMHPLESELVVRAPRKRKNDEFCMRRPSEGTNPTLALTLAALLRPKPGKSSATSKIVDGERIKEKI